MVFDLREICKNEDLSSSGNKSELIVRILSHFSSIAEEEEVLFLEETKSEEKTTSSKNIEKSEDIRTSKEIDDAIDRLISRVDYKNDSVVEDNIEKEIIIDENEHSEEIMEAEIFEAEIIEEPVVPKVEETSLILEEEDPWSVEQIISKDIVEKNTHEQAEQPSLTIVLPSIDIFKKYWKQISAVFMVVLLVGAGVIYFLSADSSFQARPLNYGDSMTFTLSDGEINMEGDEMVALLRDALPDTAIQDACNRLNVGIRGTGAVSIVEGDISQITHPIDRQSPELLGAINAKDAYGRSHLTV